MTSVDDTHPFIVVTGLAGAGKSTVALALAESLNLPVLDEDDIAYTREVLVPFLDASDKRTCIECLFGDAPGRTLGFTPRGLSPWAGLALALHDARSQLLNIPIRAAANAG